MLKKFIQSALLLVVLFTTVHSYAQVSQAPDGIQFQALATDANGRPAAGRVIYVRDAIIAKSATGSIVYSETFKVTASSAGIFTIVLGKGTYASGVTSIANIDWSNGPFFLNLKIAVEPTVPNAGWNVNNEYVDLGTSQFWSVPYALYAGNVRGADGKLNTSDTAAMLKSYFTAINIKANTADVNISLATKVDKVAGKELSTNDYTTAEKTKLAAITGINTGDQDLSALATTAALALKANTADVNISLATKVDKVAGKELSTNDYTTAEKTKLAAISGTNTGDQDLSALATTAALALKANTSDVNTALNLKANTADVNTALATKVDKVAGKELSTNDYTTAEKTKLAAITGTNTGDQINITGNASTATTAGNITATANTTLTSLSNLATVGTITSGVWSGTAVAVEKGGTGATTASAARTNLGLVIGTNVQAPLIAGTDYLVPTGSAASLTNFPTFNQNTTGNAATATTAGNITATTNTTLTSLSNLATVGTITSGVWSGTAVAVEKGGTGLTSAGTNGQVLTSNGNGALSWITPSTTATAYSGVLPLANGGTGETSISGIKSALGLLSNNVAIGSEAGTPGQGVNSNTIAIGGGAGRGNQGQSSVAIGYVSGDQNQGANSISIGGNAAQAGQGSQAVAIGYAAGQNSQGANAVAIGTFAGQSGQAANSIAINATGTGTPLNPQNSGLFVDPIRSTTATTNLLFYNTTSKEITAATGNGSFVDLTTSQTIAGIKTFSSDITVNGLKIGRGNGNNGQNVAIGADALASGTGTRNTAVGYGAMRQYSGTSFDNNTSVGYYNLPALTSGSANTSVGAESMMALTNGVANTSVGNQSLINITGSYNVGIGQRAGQTITTGSQNTIIGTDADVSTNNFSNATAIGYGASVTASNAIQLGNTSVTNVKTSGTLTAAGLVVSGDVAVNTNKFNVTSATGNTSVAGTLAVTGATTLSSATINGKAIVGASSAASASAVLEASSTTQGFLPPRMTFAQRNLISNPATGLIIFCSDCGLYGEPQFYDGIDNWRKFDQNIGSNNTGTINIVVDALEEPTNAIGGPLGGQSFTTSSAGKLVKIVTSAIGGANGTQLTNGIASSYLNIRRWVNDNETTNPNALSGEILATSNTNPTILNYYNQYFPITEFTFPNQIVLSANTKYVIEFVYGNGVYIYVKIAGTNGNGQAYDTGGENNGYVRDFPIQVYLKQF
jgi:hypothetical protein